MINTEIEKKFFNELLEICGNYVNKEMNLKKENSFKFEEKLNELLESKIDVFKFLMKEKEHKQKVSFSEKYLNERRKNETEFNEKISNFIENLEDSKLEIKFSELFKSVKEEIKKSENFEYFLSTHKTSLPKIKNQKVLTLRITPQKTYSINCILNLTRDKITEMILPVEEVLLFEDERNVAYMKLEGIYHKIILKESVCWLKLLREERLINKYELKKIRKKETRELKNEIKKIEKEKTIKIKEEEQMIYKDKAKTCYFKMIEGIRVFHRIDGGEAIEYKRKTKKERKFYYIDGEMVNKSTIDKLMLSKKIENF